MKHATTLAMAVLGAAFAAAPALATTIIPIPEPTSLSLLAAAAAGGVVACDPAQIIARRVSVAARPWNSAPTRRR